MKCWPVRQVIAPRPKSPPTPNANFRTEGITMTHSALLSRSFQLGGQATDFVLLVMNPRGANSILSSKVKLGGEASAAAGPKGRSAAADTSL